MVAAMLTSLDHLIVAVRDLDAASRQYQTLFGRHPSWRGSHPEAGTTNVLFRLDNTSIELLAPTGDGPVAALLTAWLDAHGEGLLGVAFGTENLDEHCSLLASRGLTPLAAEEGLGVDENSGAERRWRRATLPLNRTRGVLMFPIEHLSAPEILPLAPLDGPDVAAAFALDHAVVQTNDAEAAKALFGETFGLRLALDKEFVQWDARFLFFRVGGVTLEVVAALGGQSSVEGLPASDTDRLYGATYKVRNADAARARLAASGVDVSEVRAGRRPGTRVFTVRNATCGVPTLMLEFDPENAQPRS